MSKVSRKFRIKFVHVVEVDLDDVDDSTIALYRDECEDDEELALAIASSEHAESSPQDSDVEVEHLDD